MRQSCRVTLRAQCRPIGFFMSALNDQGPAKRIKRVRIIVTLLYSATCQKMRFINIFGQFKRNFRRRRKHDRMIRQCFQGFLRKLHGFVQRARACFAKRPLCSPPLIIPLNKDRITVCGLLASAGLDMPLTPSSQRNRSGKRPELAAMPASQYLADH